MGGGRGWGGGLTPALHGGGGRGIVEVEEEGVFEVRCWWSIERGCAWSEVEDLCRTDVVAINVVAITQRQESLSCITA